MRIEGTTSAGPGVVVLVHHAYLTDGRLYLVTVATGPARELSSKADHFLDSFVILK